MSLPSIEAVIGRLAALGDPVRRALYLYVMGRPDAVSRDEAATAAGISRPLAAFHLDKLVREGLLAAGYRRLSGRGGPGAGRPSKLYRRSDHELEVSLPPRDYKLLARLFTQAVAESGEAPEAVRAAARRLGLEMGSEARHRAGPRPRRERLLEHVQATLRASGYGPFLARGGEVRLRNCPFDALARDHPDVVCGVNLALMEGLLEGSRLRGARVEMDRRPGLCCVVLRWMERRRSASRSPLAEPRGAAS